MINVDSAYKYNAPVKIQKQPPEMFCKKGVLRNFTKFTKEHQCQRLIFNKVAGLQLI